jgi:hypothetical protein
MTIRVTTIEAVCKRYTQGTRIGPLAAMYGLPPQRIARILRNAEILPQVQKGRPPARPLTAEEQFERQFHREKMEFLCAANRCSIGLGYGDLRQVKRQNRSGRVDAALIKGLDDVACRMQDSYPGFLSGDSIDAQYELFDMLVSENWEPYARRNCRRRD